MATLYVAEFSQMPITDNRVPEFAMTPPLVEQTLAISATSNLSNAFNAKTIYVRVESDAVCSLAWATSGATTVTATTSNMRLSASAPEYFGVQGGGRVAVITNA